MRARAAALALALAAAPLSALGPAGSPTPVPGGTVAAEAAGTARPAGLVPVEHSGPPEPPPVNMSLLPSAWQPAPPAGVIHSNACAEPFALITGADQAIARLWGQRLFRLPELWRAEPSRGAGVTLAVIDTGVYPHRLLRGRLVGGGDYVYPGDGTQDCDGHGTAVAGIAAAAPDQLTGFSGVAPGATVLAIRQSSQNFSLPSESGETSSGATGTTGAVGTVVTLAKAVMDAVYRGARVINMSVVHCGPRNTEDATADGMLQAALHYAAQHDVVVVASAGNTGEGGCPQQPDNTTVVLPGWYQPDVLTVAAISQNGIASGFSYPGPWVGVAAPGQDLMSLSLGDHQHPDGVTQWSHDLSDAQYDRTIPMQGTSFAAPAVAGLAVLIRAKYPELTARQVIDRITATARSASTRDWTTGYGVVDPVAALTRQGPGPNPDVLPSPTASTQQTGRLALAPAPPPDRAGTGALWGGALGLLAVFAALTVAIGKARADRPRAPAPHQPTSVPRPRSTSPAEWTR